MLTNDRQRGKWQQNGSKGRKPIKKAPTQPGKCLIFLARPAETPYLAPGKRTPDLQIRSMLKKNQIRIYQTLTR